MCANSLYNTWAIPRGRSIAICLIEGGDMDFIFPDSSGTQKELIRENLEEVFHNRRSTLLVMPSISRKVIITVQRLEGCWLAGGAALALYTGDTHSIKDWDLFFKSWDHWQFAKETFKNMGFAYKTESEWSHTFELSGVEVQLVTRHFYDKVDDIFSKFDFTVCCFALDGNDLCYTAEAKKDVMNKELNFIYTENLPTCIKRIARYGAKGFMPSTAFTYKIAEVFKKTPTKKLKKMKAEKSS